MNKTTQHQKEQGQALIEMLLVLPVFLFLTGAIIGIGWAYWVRLNHVAYAQDATTMAGKPMPWTPARRGPRFIRSNVDFGASDGIAVDAATRRPGHGPVRCPRPALVGLGCTGGHRRSVHPLGAVLPRPTRAGCI